ncbi:MAG: tetratricopeptide repeat protein [Proteobacteria bacterium]|nr:tetratricopeptide repeat protein [Pseudomonadota bacterium]
MGQLFEELKRRNVVRVGIAYVIGGGLMIEVMDTIAPRLGMPDWVPTFIIIAVLIGLPIALFFSWSYELTAQGLKKTHEVDADASISHSSGRKLDFAIIGMLVLALGYFVWGKFGAEPALKTGQVTAEAKGDGLHSIAVLAFVNMSSDPDQEYFSDGISEELLNLLARIPELRVVSRTSAFSFKGKNIDIPTIAAQLNVAHILEGSVRKSGNRVRITAQLIDVKTDSHLWSETYDRELTDIFVLQEEIATAIARALAVELNIGPGQSLVTARTTDMAAYDRYLEGRSLVAKRADFSRAIQLLSEATRRDPAFAPAWAALAQAHALSFYHLRTPKVEALNAAEIAARRALEIDPDLASAHSVTADILRDRGNWSAAEESYKRALALNPDEVEANSQYAQMLLQTFRFGAALPYAEKAAQLDPLAWIHRLVRGLLWYVLGRPDDGMREIELGLSLSGEVVSGYLIQALVGMAIDQGNIERAIEFSRYPIVGSDLAGFRTEFLDHLDDPPAALASLQATVRDNPQHWSLNIYWAVHLGDLALAEDILRFTLEERLTNNPFLNGTWLSFPFLGSLRKSEDVKNLLRKTGMLDYWRTDGWPDFCRPLGHDDFECD